MGNEQKGVINEQNILFFTLSYLTLLMRAQYSQQVPEMPYLLHALVETAPGEA